MGQVSGTGGWDWDMGWVKGTSMVDQNQRIRPSRLNLGTRDWDIGSVTWRDYWLISGRKSDRLECVPACIYRCHYVRALVLQRVGTYECVHLCVSVSIYSYRAMYLLCLCLSLFGVPSDPLSGARSDPLSGAPSEPPTVFLSML